jgi:mannose-6-phosphate isomerase-like protein (cupin superfamily)
LPSSSEHPSSEQEIEAPAEYPRVIRGAGYAIGDLDALGEGPGFRKVRKGLEVTAFGVNAVVMPAGIESGFHAHERQEELYFVHRGTLEMEFGDGSRRRLEAGTFARVDAPMMRKLRNVGDEDAVYLCVGGKGGYVGRDGRIPQDDPGPRARRIDASAEES